MKRIIIWIIIFNSIVFCQYVQKKWYLNSNNKPYEVTDRPWISPKYSTISMKLWFTDDNIPSSLDIEDTRESFTDMIDTWNNVQTNYDFTEEYGYYNGFDVGFTNNVSYFGGLEAAKTIAGIVAYALEYDNFNNIRIVGFTFSPVTSQVQSVIYFNNTDAFKETHVWTLNTMGYPPYGKDWSYFPKDALHELGHVLGLAHNDKSGAVMYPNSSITLPTVTFLESFEIQAVNDIYFWYNPVPVSVGDYIALTVDHDIFEVGTTHVGCIHPNFVCICGEIPPCTMNEYDMEVFALSDCGEVLIYVNHIT